MAAVGHQNIKTWKMTMLKMTMTGVEIEGHLRSTTRTTEQERRLGEDNGMGPTTRTTFIVI
jgi:hypothetical protein